MQIQPRYKKGDKIGERYLVYQALMGGMGEVYLCLDLQTNRPFALKTFQARYLTNPKIREAFNREVASVCPEIPVFEKNLRRNNR